MKTSTDSEWAGGYFAFTWTYASVFLSGEIKAFPAVKKIDAFTIDGAVFGDAAILATCKNPYDEWNIGSSIVSRVIGSKR
jgi:hypothetical protein